ncbi:sodium-extruding oxaloacetate decarboxylase subunit alpha [Thermodesulfovibrio yellowstonii]|uniref:Oxaloacetate decarboxylase alpha subunit n=1 Tax=Thermodesulfovibrio yellowstonii (strain ATCC 51303 / DSM 11347 / YP87) TaxID=289376 RepID=B5YH38_THEYD|nr:sodium-extruding oxaloacetate decarboxylase subunit alpha [Thermodesulfovibrio yellowstonii]ACI20298.1 oxaloacetate decarboxylase alpha subunit [Thermodesulfovibrio yellowstonii DSM 11347]
MSKSPVKIMDTTFRDAHQSLHATRMKLEDIVPIAEKMDQVGFHSLEVWGGATFDSCLRFLREDPWERLRTIRALVKNTKLQMLLRGQNLVGYRHYPDDVVEKFVEKTIENGIDILRIFDALNDLRNMEKSISATLKYGGTVEAAFCYTIGPIYTVDYFIKLAKNLRDMGAHIICIKDMAGLLDPYTAYELIKRLKEEINLPIHLHTHDTAGMAVATTIKAIEAGVDIVDTAISTMAGGTSQPSLETICHILRGTERDPGFNMELLDEIADYFYETRKKYKTLESEYIGPDPKVIVYQVPGGMLSNLVNQLREQNALHRIKEVMEEIPRVREDFGYPPLVTPSSQIVGTQATLNVLTGERYKMVTTETKNYFKGLYGKPPVPVNEEIRKKILGEEEFITCRPADLLEPEFEKAKTELKDKAHSDEDVLSYCLFPKIYLEFLEAKEKGIKEEIPVSKKEEAKPAATSLAPTEFVINLYGESYHVKVGGKGHKVDGKRPYFLYINNQLVEVIVEPLQEIVPSEEGKVEIKPKESVRSRPSEPGDITSPMPGTVVKIKVKKGDIVSAGDTVVIVEAMKMENEIHSPIDGTVEEIYIKEGDMVNPDEVMIRIK